MKKKFLTAISILLSLLLLLSGCSGADSGKEMTYTDALFDTVISVSILDSSDESILKGCEELCKKYDVMFSRTDKNGEIYKINKAHGSSVEVSPETVTLIKKGLYYCDLSDGAFDITIGSASRLWKFGKKKASVPDEETLAEAVQHIDYKNVIINGNRVRLSDPYAVLDLGAVAKGYIADLLKDYLVENGVSHALINLGGNVLAVGDRMDGSEFNIGIQKPFDKSGEPITAVKIRDKSVVTTGIYQRYFKEDGVLYHHILDPATGFPCSNNLYSVTIITDSSLTADALSTTCFLLGYDKAMRLVNQLDNVDAVFITDDDQLHYSNNFMK